jgi:uncharacterized protein involved in tolerance to divalent cations
VLPQSTGAAAAGSQFFWQAQLEQGTEATSIIPTTSATVTRNEDVIDIDSYIAKFGERNTRYLNFTDSKKIVLNNENSLLPFGEITRKYEINNLDTQLNIDTFDADVVEYGANPDVKTILSTIRNIEEPKLLMIAGKGKVNELQSLLPTDNSGDFDVVRATTAWYRDSDGLFKEASANVPRFQFNTDGSFAGLLVEPQRTNLVLRSQEFDDAYWTKESFTEITSNAAASPDGTMNADKYFVTSGETGFNRINRLFTGLTIGESLTFSIYVKADGYGFFLVRLVNFLSTSVNVGVNLINKVVTFADSGLTVNLFDEGNDWLRIQITGVLNDTTPRIFFRGQPTATIDNSIGQFTGDGTSGVFIWQAQLEQGTEATSIIPTTSAAVTRNEDVIDVTTPAGVTEIVETFSDGSTNTETTIPATYQIPNGEIKSIVMT